MIAIQNLLFNYRRKGSPVFSDLSLDINEGSIYGLIGKNGTGKSTLLYLIAGLLTPKKGEILYNGVSTRKRLPQTLADIFIVPEEFNLPSQPLKDFIASNAPFYPKFSNDDLLRNLNTFGMSPDTNLGALSMGQKKKISMSFALACNTSLLLMDEPTNGLDIPSKANFRQFIAQSMNDKRTIVISTHQVRDIDRLLDHVIITEGGKILLNAPVEKIVAALNFFSTNEPEVAKNALYSRPSLEGFEVVAHNDGSAETEVNLETLFEFATSNPAAAQQLFNEHNPQK